MGIKVRPQRVNASNETNTITGLGARVPAIAPSRAGIARMSAPTAGPTVFGPGSRSARESAGPASAAFAAAHGSDYGPPRIAVARSAAAARPAPVRSSVVRAAPVSPRATSVSPAT